MDPYGANTLGCLLTPTGGDVYNGYLYSDNFSSQQAT